ncbi:MAG: trypsin-like peptidase domain-containing protein [Vampirovibrionales bacterium]
MLPTRYHAFQFPHLAQIALSGLAGIVVAPPSGRQRGYGGSCGLAQQAFNACHRAHCLNPYEQHISKVYNTASQTVVNITTYSIRYDDNLNPLPKQGSGSGVVVSADGLVVTNNHVIEGAQSVEVSLTNGSQYAAKLIGRDANTDLALIQLIADKPLNLMAIPMGNSEHLQVGQTVLAIGNPFGFNSTLSTGVISSLNRHLRAPNGRLIEQVIQTDAAINPGNSGGPLLDSQGRLIGINTALYSPNGASAGISLTIPVNQVIKVVNDLMTHGRVVRPYLGLTTNLQVNPRVAKLLQLDIDHGLVVGHVVAGSPADKAGLRAGTNRLLVGNQIVTLGGDVLVEVDNQPVTTFDQFVRYLESKQPNDTHKVEDLAQW